MKEAIHLRDLYRTSPASLPKPYQSKTLHLPPILLVTLGPLISGCTSEEIYFRTTILWSLIDVLAALVLANILDRKQRYNKRKDSFSKGNASFNTGTFLESRGGLAAVYLFNPYTLASCLARSTSSVNNLAVLVAIDSALAGEFIDGNSLDLCD